MTSPGLEQALKQRDHARQVAMDFETELHAATQALEAFWRAHCTSDDNPAKPNLLAQAVELHATWATIRDENNGGN